jgi:hypothetical protein
MPAAVKTPLPPGAKAAPIPSLVGSGRCGAALLRVMVASLPDLAIPPETQFIGLGAGGCQADAEGQSAGPARPPCKA